MEVLRSNVILMRGPDLSYKYVTMQLWEVDIGQEYSLRQLAKVRPAHEYCLDVRHMTQVPH